MELPKVYNPKEVEDAIYRSWEESGCFNPDNLHVAKDAESFTIAMPPPNATGVLHLGHAMTMALEDAMIRFARMRGLRALWVPGTDHAAIATQNVVEKKLAKEHITRHDLGRKKFLEKVAEHVTESQHTIKNQIRKMGASCDWSRERYTLDDGLTRAVQEVFVRMYHDGLIYRGNRIVNWCPRCHSTLADDEIAYEEKPTTLFTFRYNNDFPIAISTTRPETKLGDTAVAVHPDDTRYKKYVGKIYAIRFGDVVRHVQVIADTEVDMNFGTGAVGVTPAHSMTDYALAERHGAEVVKIIGEDGVMLDAAGADYKGLPVGEARQKFIAWLQAEGLVEKEEFIVHNLSVCYRCGTPVEPLPSEQWFVSVDKPFTLQYGHIQGIKKGSKYSLKELALHVVREGLIEIIPGRFNKTYFNWMENLHDWCISRQIWFGHRIPVWHRKDSAIYVGVKQPEGEGWIQDPDTLDTWFSSGLWTFSTLGWPEDTHDLKTFHPTSVLETGYDILFFWIARMILMTTYALNDIPFKQVYLHGLVRDKEGRKMSKSLGNGINPIVMIERYGADALRVSMMIGNAAGNDVRLYAEKIEGYRNFVNKLWNIARYVLMSVKEITVPEAVPNPQTLADRWILARLAETATTVTKALIRHDFSLAGETLRACTWNDFADWYVEISKKEEGKDAILLYVLDMLLKLWHPLMPFVTEHLYRLLHGEDAQLIVAAWPKHAGKYDAKALAHFGQFRDMIQAVRTIRAENHLAPTVGIAVTAVAPEAKELGPYAHLAAELLRATSVALTDTMPFVPHAAVQHAGQVMVLVPLEGLVDIEREKKRLEKECQRTAKYVQSVEQKLANRAFIAHAPVEVVVAEKGKLTAAQEKLDKLSEQLAHL
ncbi:MAG: valine--tRNA ligase [Parcubacteria group bacterium CG2_30_48_51]|nr:MAG: valine--tRNA ligase [Parcubacteria group bacterium CG2_30_48_51]